MDFGITVATAADSWKVVKRAEELGFTYAWFYDTQMLNADPFVAMAAAAVHTRTIHLGIGVLVPSNRLAPVTANCLASLNKLAPGRIHCGIGTGFTARRAMGLGAVKLDDMAEGFDHGVGHSLLVLCDAKAPHGKKWNYFKALENYLFIVSISLS